MVTLVAALWGIMWEGVKVAMIAEIIAWALEALHRRAIRQVYL